WNRRAYTWHEAADTRVFHPRTRSTSPRDAVWIGNWGNNERSAEFSNYFISPVRELKLTATAYGVRYPDAARRAMRDAGIEYKGWLPNYEAPLAYARHHFTMHIPRKAYLSELPGIATIRVFEALACGIPLVSLDWHDVEGLFEPGLDFLVAHNPTDMRDWCAALAADEGLRQTLSRHGLDTIRRRHTCAHRVDELLHIFHQLRGRPRTEVATV
ncbi:MAG: glycosyltransferase, partial [Vicinamibacterales bacterium]